MPKSSNQGKHSRLSAEFPFFIYEEFTCSLEQYGLNIRFHFNLSDRHHFYPTLFIPRKNWAFTDDVLNSILPSLVFHIGMIELISYWKTACPPLLIIKPTALDKEQILWWKKLYFNGLGEFFYLNSIYSDHESFMEIRAEGTVFHTLATPDVYAGVIIPVGGGKDSAVTLEMLRGKFETMPLVLNPRTATSAVIEKSLDAGCGLQDAGCGMQESLAITRTIDPLLLKLNAEGFLNGHTPFSALLAFICLTAAVLTGRKYIVLSNEASANEATIPGTNINHQYSKSLEFENDFREYVSKYITRNIEYFSFLRPLNEVQIASLFSAMPFYHEVFRSCNAGSKTGSWCGKCPKCLFTFIILAPFMGIERLTSIFGSNLLDDPALAEILFQFTGAAKEKPFDCIGTISEVNLALCEIIRQCGEKSLPVLLRVYKDSEEFTRYRIQDFDQLMKSYQPSNLPVQFENILKARLHA